MEIKKGFYKRNNGSEAILKVVDIHESGDPLCLWIFSTGAPFRYHHYEFTKEFEPITEDVVNSLDRHTCPRRYVDGTIENPDVWYKKDDYRTCSYCGSLHPDDLLTIIKDEGFGVIEKSTKSYKWYVSCSKGHLKYYRPHDTESFIEGYNKLIDKSRKGTE